MMSQRAATATYLIFATGFSFAVYALFYWLCDRHHWSLGIFDTFGSNALAAYVIHSIVDSGVSPFVPGDAPAWYVTVSFAMFLGISYLFVRSLQKQGIFLRL